MFKIVVFYFLFFSPFPISLLFVSCIYYKGAMRFTTVPQGETFTLAPLKLCGRWLFRFRLIFTLHCNFAFFRIQEKGRSAELDLSRI